MILLSRLHLFLKAVTPVTFFLCLFLALIVKQIRLPMGIFTLLSAIYILMAYWFFSKLTIFEQIKVNANHSKSISELHVISRKFPFYRFVDLLREIENFTQQFSETVKILSQHDESLNDILSGIFYSGNEAIIRSLKVPIDISYQKQEFFYSHLFWVIANNSVNSIEGCVILRLRLIENQFVILEIAAQSSTWAEEAITQINEKSIEQSIFRGRLLQIGFESGVKNDQGDIDSYSTINVTFKNEKPVTRNDIVLDDDIHEILDRNIFAFHKNRDALKKYGVPNKRGLLFYGPPGTGKTYTCQYIYSNIENVTTFVVTGHSLAHVKSICNLARMLQPSIVVLEDVDLIFSSREISLYSSALGDLLDEMDGFQHSDAVVFLLTTNAIDRLEKAIKDRPGRISQCVYFGPPNHELRVRYLERYLRPYEYSNVDLQALSKKTKGASQAFLKELVFRAVQVAFEKNGQTEGQLSLSLKDFETAISEMTRFNESATRSIIGFHTET